MERELDLQILDLIDELKTNEKYRTWNDFFARNEVLVRGILYKIYDIRQGNAVSVCPLLKDIFRFAEVPVNKIKCVFVGMDPYPTMQKFPNDNRPVATGRSFEVGDVYYWIEGYKQSSLRNILKSLYYYDFNFERPIDELRIIAWTGNWDFLQKNQFYNMRDWFDNMERQGVLFLNAALSVQEGVPNSHMEIWREFMERLVEYIKENSPNAKWILAGKAAQSRFENALGEKNIVRCSHPRMPGFVSECPFKQVKGIKWTKKVKA